MVVYIVVSGTWEGLTIWGMSENKKIAEQICAHENQGDVQERCYVVPFRTEGYPYRDEETRWQYEYIVTETGDIKLFTPGFLAYKWKNDDVTEMIKQANGQTFVIVQVAAADDRLTFDAAERAFWRWRDGQKE